MTDLLLAIGLVLAVEGLVFASVPAFVRRRMLDMLALDDGHLRIAGLVSAVIGVGLVWLARHGVG